MLIRHDILRRIERGEVTLAFRRWQRPRVRKGSTMRTAVGVVEVTAIDEVDMATEEEAIAAGFGSLAALRAADEGRAGRLYRIGLRHAGVDPRIALRDEPAGEEEYAAVMGRLRRLDASSSHGPWTRETLLLISGRPAVRAADLAASVGREKKPFKLDVRKLKELGLTESLRTGYRLSPRGESIVARWTR